MKGTYHVPQNQPPQSANVDVSNAGQAAGIQLPPALANLIASLRDERKALLKEMPVADEATRKYLAHFLYPKLIECVEALGVGLTETYMVASQAFTETSRMREYVDKRLSADRDDSGGGSLRIDPDDIEVLRETLAALGLLLVKKLPDDAEVQVAFNLVTEAFVAVGGDGAVDEDDEDDEDGEGDDEGDEDEESVEPPPVTGGGN